jgi:hypothetical protein
MKSEKMTTLIGLDTTFVPVFKVFGSGWLEVDVIRNH